MWILSHLEDKHPTLHLNQTFDITPRPVRDRQFILPTSTWDKLCSDNVNLSSLTRNLSGGKCLWLTNMYQCIIFLGRVILLLTGLSCFFALSSWETLEISFYLKESDYVSWELSAAETDFSERTKDVVICALCPHAATVIVCIMRSCLCGRESWRYSGFVEHGDFGY